MSQTKSQLLGPVKNIVSGDITLQGASNTASRVSSHGFICRDNWGSASSLGNGMTSPSSNTLMFATNSTERLRIKSDGLFDISGGVQITENVTPTSGAGLELFREGNGGGQVQAFDRSGSAWLPLILKGSTQSFHASGSERFRIDANGLIGTNARVPSNYGSPNFLLSGDNTTLTIMGDGSTNNSSFAGIKFRIAGASSGDYTKAGIFAQRRASYNDLDLIVAFRSSNDNVSVNPFDQKLRIDSDGKVIMGNTARVTPFIIADGGLCIEQTHDALLNAICVRNSHTSSAAATAINFSLNRSGSDQDYEGGRISLHKEQNWTTSSSTIGGQFKIAVAYQGVLRGRLIVGGGGLISPVKGGNSQYAGGTILGRYAYTQSNQGNGHYHYILGPDGRALNNYLTNNVSCNIFVRVQGTGTMTAYCEYFYENNSSVNSAVLTHLRGNSSANSNRPYMSKDGQIPYWLMSHSGSYTISVTVTMYGGTPYSSYKQASEGNYTSNP